ncbi:MAG: von Willebrand factor type A domain-containing protein [Bacteroidales bacterium]|jgi:Ca-activated chloride channel family protein|nr:von Willebrand factor type A domain-containing protein [Bacteroidales bacterium]
MKRIISILILSFLTVALYAASINGTVKNKKGEQISGAEVSLLQSGKQIAKTQTDINGVFTFANLNPGHYNIYAEKSGYEKSLPQSLIITDNSEKTINFVLKPINIKPVKEEVVLEVLSVVEDDAEMSVSYSGVSQNNQYGNAKRNRSLGGYNYDQPAVQHNTEDYSLIEENRFHSAKDKPLSTFSIDVDKASYANVRRFINQNQMPPKDAVRVEELINYFSYDYPQPTDGHPFASHLEYGDCPWNENHKLLMIGLKGEEIENEDVPASNIVFLLDVSGSMNNPNKLPLLKRSFEILIEKLRPEDRVAIVVYAGNAGAVLESTPGNEKDKIKLALNNLSAGGSTAGGEGIQLAYKIAKENFIQNGNNRVILATDGDFNIGASSDAELVRMIEEKRDDGIFLTILGFGMGNYKDNKMEQLSNKGNGNYAYIDNILEAKKMFADELWGTLYTIAKDVKIQIEFNPNVVESYRLIGYENRLLNDEDFNDDKKDAGEIGAGHTVTALYEIIPTGSNEKTGDVDDLIYQSRKLKNSADLLTLKLRYKAPDENTSRLLTEAVKAKPVSESALSENFKLASAAAMYGMLLRNSEHKANASWEKALEYAKAAKGEDKFGYRAEFITLMQKAEYLSK